MKGGECFRNILLFFGSLLLMSNMFTPSVLAVEVDTNVSAIVINDPPAVAAEITFPIDGARQTISPILVKGLCSEDVLVRLYNNGHFVGSDICVGGQFSILMPLNIGPNRLVAIVYDALDQAGPNSNIVDVTYAPAKTTGAKLKILTSTTRQTVDPGDIVTWELSITGGQEPYALLVDWGDGSREPVSLATAGKFEIRHVYNEAGNYSLIIEATDTNDLSTVLQLAVEVRGEQPSFISTTNIYIDPTTILLLWLTALAILFYWLGYYFGERRLERRQFHHEPRFWA